jgi:hypothetical protein
MNYPIEIFYKISDFLDKPSLISYACSNKYNYEKLHNIENSGIGLIYPYQIPNNIFHTSIKTAFFREKYDVENFITNFSHISNIHSITININNFGCNEYIVQILDIIKNTNPKIIHINGHISIFMLSMIMNNYSFPSISELHLIPINSIHLSYEFRHLSDYLVDSFPNVNSLYIREYSIYMSSILQAFISNIKKLTIENCAYSLVHILFNKTYNLDEICIDFISPKLFNKLIRCSSSIIIKLKYFSMFELYTMDIDINMDIPLKTKNIMLHVKNEGSNSAHIHRNFVSVESIETYISLLPLTMTKFGILMHGHINIDSIPHKENIKSLHINASSFTGNISSFKNLVTLSLNNIENYTNDIYSDDSKNIEILPSNIKFIESTYADNQPSLIEKSNRLIVAGFTRRININNFKCKELSLLKYTPNLQFLDNMEPEKKYCENMELVCSREHDIDIIRRCSKIVEKNLKIFKSVSDFVEFKNFMESLELFLGIHKKLIVELCINNIPELLDLLNLPKILKYYGVSDWEYSPINPCGYKLIFKF